MDDIHLSFTISVTLPLAKPSRLHRDGPMRHPASGWGLPEASSKPPAPRLPYIADPDTPNEGVVIPGGVRALRRMQRQDPETGLTLPKPSNR